ncbi:hypothetical protein BH10PSE12_BH10PSE12_28290 [soil metagenome]
MYRSESNVSALLLVVLIVGLGVAALNAVRGSSIDYGNSRERASTGRVFEATDTRTFLAFNALASTYNPRRADLE